MLTVFRYIHTLVNQYIRIYVYNVERERCEKKLKSNAISVPLEDFFTEIVCGGKMFFLTDFTAVCGSLFYLILFFNFYFRDLIRFIRSVK